MPLKLVINFSIIISIACFQNAIAQKRIYNIMAFGANADGQTNNTIAIQKAIDEAGNRGGGIVLVPHGKFITGVLHLQSAIELHLSEGAELLGSTKRADYGSGNASPLIVADHLHDVSITGKGVIDGQARELLENVFKMLNEGTLQDPEWKTENPWHQKRPAEANRPKLLDFINCSSIYISGITLKNAATWVQNYKECDHLVIDSIKVESTSYWNNDGIDVVDCSDVRITNCFINASDDGICLKSENAKSICENIFIANCTVRSSASAIKFGTASYGGFKNIIVKDIYVYDTYRSAIALESVDGGILDSVLVQNIHAKNTGNAIFIRLGHRNKTETIGKVQHVFIKDVFAEVPAGKPDKGYETEGPELKYPHNVFPASIVGLPGHPVQDVKLENIEIIYEGGAKKETAFYNPDSLTRITENESGYPEFSMFGELPAWGFYVRHAEGLTMKNIKLSYKKDDFRVPCIFDNVSNLDITGLRIPAAKSSPVILLNNVKNHSLKNTELPKGIKQPIKEQ
jgi:polygalacturonase